MYVYIDIYICISDLPDHDQTPISCIAVRLFIIWATRKPMYQCVCVYICAYVYIYVSPRGTTQIKLYIISNNTEDLFMFLYGPMSTQRIPEVTIIQSLCPSEFHSNAKIQSISFYVWPLSLSTVSLRFISIVSCSSGAFVLITRYDFIV